MVITFALANSDNTVNDNMNEEIAKKLYSMPRLDKYKLKRKNYSGCIKDNDYFPSLHRGILVNTQCSEPQLYPG